MSRPILLIFIILSKSLDEVKKGVEGEVYQFFHNFILLCKAAIKVQLIFTDFKIF